jgi:hypothetical protein
MDSNRKSGSLIKVSVLNERQRSRSTGSPVNGSGTLKSPNVGIDFPPGRKYHNSRVFESWSRILWVTAARKTHWRLFRLKDQVIILSLR